MIKFKIPTDSSSIRFHIFCAGVILITMTAFMAFGVWEIQYFTLRVIALGVVMTVASTIHWEKTND